MRASRTVAWALVACVGLLGASGCGAESTPENAASDGQGAWAGSCVRIPALLEEERACGRDDDCPCGSSCELGECTIACVANADCAEGMVCDGFGRCTPVELANRPAPLGSARTEAASGDPSWLERLASFASASAASKTTAPRGSAGLEGGTLRLDREAIELLSKDAVAAVHLSVGGSTLQRVRVAADAGLEVECASSGAYSSECELGPLASADPPVVIRIRPSGAFPSENVRSAVALHAGSSRREIGVLLRGGARPAEVPREGVYEGTAWLVGAGMRARTQEDTLPADLARLRLNIQARVFAQPGGKYRVAFEDARGAVFPRGAVGDLALTNDSKSWQMVVPSRQYLGDDVDSPEDDALDIHAKETMSGATFEAGVLTGDVVTEFEGVTTAAYTPFVRWRLSLSRTGALPSGEAAPQVVARPVADVSSRALAPFREEGGVAVIPDFGTLTAKERAIAAWCTPVDATEAVTGFGGSTDARNDLLCDQGESQRAFATTLGSLLSRGDYIDSCVEAFSPESLAWGEASPESPCASRSRALTTIALALDVDRNRAFGLEATPSLPLSRLGSRAFQLWMGAQSIVGSDPMRIAVLGPLLPAGTDVDKLRYYASYKNAVHALQRSVSAWDVVLHPRVGTALAAMPPEALRFPDYRGDFVSGAFSGGEQAMGLPVTMLATLTSQLDGVTGLVDALANHRITGSEANRYAAEVSAFMPRSVVVFAMAQGLRDAARSDGTEPWENSWLAARAKYGAALAKLSVDLRALESRANPLGIGDDDLPLYRIGEQQGAGSRFSAVSDSLLGREDSSSPAIAQVLIARAQDAEIFARGSLERVLERDERSEREARAIERNVESIKRLYGEQVASLCGIEDLDTLEVLDNASRIDANTCFVADECKPSPKASQARYSAIDQAYQVCMLAKLRGVLGEALTTGGAEMDRYIDELEPSFRAGEPFPELPERLQALYPEYKEKHPGGVHLPSHIDADRILEARYLCDSARAESVSMRPESPPASCETTDDCPAAMICEEAICKMPEQLSPNCFRGSIGAQLLVVQAAATDLEIARHELADYVKAYELAMANCILLEENAERVAEVTEKFKQSMAAMASIKAVADIAEKAISVAREVAQSSTTDVVKAFSTPVAIALGVAETAAFATSTSLETAMEAAERSHEATIDAFDRETEIAVCKNEAGSALIGQSAAALRIERQAQELAMALYELSQMQGSIQGTLDEGLAAVAYERARAAMPSNADYWLDSNVDLFQQRLRRARRALYLALMGVEYEFQQTSAERGNVLAAQSAFELEAILDRVRDGVRRGAPRGGGNPTELLSVLSLRKNILQLADRTGLPDGWQKLGDVERFQRMLVDQQFAVHDSTGAYVGQEIPFSLAPIGRSNLADPSGIPLLSGLSCAERLWSVNAVVLGSDLMVGTDTTLTTLQLRKRNTFQSQLCAPDADGSLQVASTRPSTNLFIDPLSASSFGEDATLASLTSTGETNAYSFATVQARLNVDRGSVEMNDYAAGSSTALAGRGVFGEYTLFIPRSSLSIDGSTGLALHHVEDILIRLDYVAAERQ